MNEYLPLVDENGRVTGKALRSEVHGNPSLMHPVVHLHIFDSRGRLLFQRRAPSKDLYPGFWDTAVGGHVAFGEDAEDALRREAFEELEVRTETARFLYSYVMRNPYETEFVSTWSIVCDGPFTVNADEVAEVRFFSKQETAEKLGRGFFTPNAEEEIARLSADGSKD